MSNHLGRKVVKYAVLPGFIPRISRLFSSSFALSAYSIACIFYSIRLLPPSHPYVNADNIGRFGLRHVMAAAADHLDFRWRNFDQLLIYFLILSGIVLLLAQFSLMAISLVAQQPAMAALSDYFVRSADEHHQDLVMIVMDRVFGVPDFFNSCISVADVPCEDLYGNMSLNLGEAFPFPFHKAFHQMLGFYSTGLFFVATLVLLYFIVVVVSETATTGSPFGQRYNKTWIPLRIILFFALLTPFAAPAVKTNETEAQQKARVEAEAKAGLNAAQLLTLWVAKTGSDFASNGWELFTNELPRQSDLARVNLPSFEQVMSFVLIARTCKAVEESFLGPRDEGKTWIQPYVIRGGFTALRVGDASSGTAALPLLETDYKTARAYAEGPSVEIGFGIYSDDKAEGVFENASAYPDHVWPVCGRMSLPVYDRGLRVEVSSEADEGEGDTDTDEEVMTPTLKVQELYYILLQDLWTDDSIIKIAQCFASSRVPALAGQYERMGCPDVLKDKEKDLADMISQRRQLYDDQYQAFLDEYDDGVSDFQQILLKRGWAGAALWYNQIADVNGRVTAAIQNPPEVAEYPSIMEFVQRKKRAIDEDLILSDLFNPLVGSGEYIDFSDYNKGGGSQDQAQAKAFALQAAYATFSDAAGSLSAQGAETGNVLMALVDTIFGAGGLYDLRKNTEINPLAQLSALGKAIMDASIRNILGGLVIDKMPFFLRDLLGKNAKDQLKTLGSSIQAIGYVGVLMGFSLFYVLPLMPFIYFFFAFGAWVKSIFEAIVAMPLWAMAHITRWDGDGIAGPDTKNGYFLLFEIFVRPILILFGLLASISVFSASAEVLHDIFDTVVANVGGASADNIGSAMGAIDELFYTLVYTVLIYMIGLSCFKLIDQIPNEIFRWMTVRVDTFHDNSSNAAESLSGSVNQGLHISSSKLMNLTSAEKIINLQ